MPEDIKPANPTTLVHARDYSAIVAKWSDAHRYSPAPRHRRRMILSLIKDLDFKSCVDVGCAQPFLIEDMLKLKEVALAGCDISQEVILLNKKVFPQVDFFTADISQPQPSPRTFDLVICSEVLEHVEDWPLAVRNIAAWSCQWLLITVPSGTVYPIDKQVGHLRHFEGVELLKELQSVGFEPMLVRRWGFPFHSAYKYMINGFLREQIYTNFAEKGYGLGQKIISTILYGLFFLNTPFNHGSQLLILLKRKQKPGAAQ